jgi:hypothetical protein
MADKNQGGFKVTDRRLFNPDGTLREEALAEQSAGNAGSIGKQADIPPLHSEPEPPQAGDFPDNDFGDMPEQTMFTEFLMGIASSTFIYLGLVEHPGTGRRQVNLTAAKESIEMLRMLREKTKGNLTKGEEKFFEDLLADLQMQFVSVRG